MTEHFLALLSWLTNAAYRQTECVRLRPENPGNRLLSVYRRFLGAPLDGPDCPSPPLHVFLAKDLRENTA